ncbi:19312_t:CDS:2 [Entrophospora sp. SA101]|nr:19312_t:CDS:2 [Entrophospora sp. SA101]
MSKKPIPYNWSNDVTYLYYNDYISTSLKPSPYDVSLIKTHPIHPFTASSLLPVAITPNLPNPLVKIKYLKDQKDHPAYPGNGLFATKDLKESTLIISYNGNEARFINDYRGISKKPNAIFHEYIDLNTGMVNMGVWVISGIGKIKKGSEILVSYAISINNWYLDRRMKSEKIKSYLKTICIDVGIDVQDRKIVNHSRRSLFDMAILALDTNKSTDINEINNQAVNNKNAVIIDLKDSYELPKENDVSTSKITQVIEGSSMDLNSEIINKLNINNDKLIDNSNSNCSKRMGGINKIDKHYSNKPIQKTQIT